MKKERYHIALTWMLLLCFAAGQYMVYAHQHYANAGSSKPVYHHSDSQPEQTVTDYCPLCDAMHHNTMAVSSVTYFAPVVTGAYFYKIIQHDFVSIALILSAGRSPPMA